MLLNAYCICHIAYYMNILWLYPQQLNLYGDRGNMECLIKRLQWRNIKVSAEDFNIGDSVKKIANANLLFAGGGPDSLQREVAKDTTRLTQPLNEALEKGTVGLFICGFYQLLGNYYRPAEGADIMGLGILDLYTEHFGNRKKRCVGNIVTNPVSPIPSIPLSGFENHEGRTFLNTGAKPLAKVKKGFGNNGVDKTEGAVLNNFIGTYLHGPLLPKNPHLADYLLEKAVGKKLEPLNDELEWQAHDTLLE